MLLCDHISPDGKHHKRERELQLWAQQALETRSAFVQVPLARGEGTGKKYEYPNRVRFVNRLFSPPAWLFDSEKEKSVEMTIGPLVSPRLSPLFAIQFPEFHYSSFPPVQ